MKRSEKSYASVRNYAPGLIVSVFFAASIGGYLWQSSSELELRIEQQTAHKAANHTDTANIAIENKCSNIPASDIYDCVSEERYSADNRQREEYDLEAQQIMTVWTRSMGQAAIIGMMVGFLGLGLIFVTFRETRKTAEIGRETLTAYITAERGFVVVNASKIPLPGSRKDVGIRVTNIGKSDVVINSSGWVQSKNIEWPGDNILSIDRNKHVRVGESQPIMQIDHNPDEGQFIFGEISYECPFNPNHTTYFTLHVVRDGADLDIRKFIASGQPGNT